MSIDVGSSRSVKISGERFAALWRDTAMSQETFAAALGMKRSGVFRLMRAGVHGMFTDNFRRLAELVGTSPQHLLTRIGEGENRSFGLVFKEPARGDVLSGVTGTLGPLREVRQFHGISAGARGERLAVERAKVKVPEDLGDFCVRVDGRSMLPEYPHEAIALFEQVEGQQFVFGKDYLIWFTDGECYFSRVYESEDDRDVLVLRKLNPDREQYPDRRVHRRDVHRIARSTGVLIRKT